MPSCVSRSKRLSSNSRRYQGCSPAVLVTLFTTTALCHAQGATPAFGGGALRTTQPSVLTQLAFSGESASSLFPFAAPSSGPSINIPAAPALRIQPTIPTAPDLGGTMSIPAFNSAPQHWQASSPRSTHNAAALASLLAPPTQLPRLTANFTSGAPETDFRPPAPRHLNGAGRAANWILKEALGSHGVQDLKRNCDRAKHLASLSL